MLKTIPFVHYSQSPVINPGDLVRALATLDATIQTASKTDPAFGGYFDDYVSGLRDELEAGGASALANSKAIEDAALLLRYLHDQNLALFMSCDHQPLVVGSRPTITVVALPISKSPHQNVLINGRFVQEDEA